ncbi:shikimate kinase [Flavobacterium pallidum]|uniref:Shikimate kinase n=1 Tax=Flavobacterium pallidum TaxID=2172098 RepID=A0A2S1SHC3_9FLAO|nr:shikimate kinase [Flavobacterium pallidum]AWI25816.1 shikimate kinase [Flavobacterium pallidum]
MRKIILLGYMGSGKTTVGKILSQKIHIPAYDLDEIIEESEQAGIPEIFSSKGEIWFRKAEHKALMVQLQRPESFILSLGGGTPCYANNHEFLKQEDVISIYLKATVGTLMQRLREGISGRPLITSISEQEQSDYIAAHLFERSFYYNQARFKINTDALTPEGVAQEIIKLLAQVGD